MQNVVKREKKLYRKNMIHGRLKPDYRSEKDLLALAKNEQEAAFMQNFCSKLNEDGKHAMYKYIQIKPDYISCMMRGLKTPELKQILSIKTVEGAPVFSKSAQEALVQASPERIKAFAEIAGEMTADGAYKYKHAAQAINHPRFDLIKKIADIEVNGKNPFAECAGSLYLFSAEEVEQIYKTITSLPADKKAVTDFISKLYCKVLTTTKTEQIRCLLGS